MSDLFKENETDTNVKSEVQNNSKEETHDHASCSHNQNDLTTELTENLIFLAVKCDISLCSALISKFGNELLKKFDESGFSVLHWAAYGGDMNILILVLTEGKSLNEEDLYDYDEKGEIIVKCNPNILSNNDANVHPFHWAVQSKSFKIVDLFLKLKVDINVVDSKGYTPLILSVQKNLTEMAIYLVSKGCSIHELDHEGDNALHWAAYKGNLELVEFFISLGMDPSQADKILQTPLHLATLGGHVQALAALLRHNSNHTVKDKNGNDCISLACRKGHTQIVELLSKFQKNPNDSFQEPVCIDVTDFTSSSENSYDELSRRVSKRLSKVVLGIFVLNILVLTGVSFYKSPHDIHVLGIAEPLFVLSSIVCVSFYHWVCSTLSPGYIHMNLKEYESALNNLRFITDPVLMQQQKNLLCNICKVKLDSRSFHCRLCKKCVNSAEFHDLLFDNCIGRENRSRCFMFYFFVILWIISLFIYSSRMEGGVFKSIYFTILSIELLIFGFFLLKMLYAISINLTYNEITNWSNNHELVDKDGKFINRYNKEGKLKNIGIFVKREIIPEVKSNLHI